MLAAPGARRGTVLITVSKGVRQPIMRSRKR
jgi:hypothetical protein